MFVLIVYINLCLKMVHGTVHHTRGIENKKKERKCDYSISSWVLPVAQRTNSVGTNLLGSYAAPRRVPRGRALWQLLFQDHPNCAFRDNKPFLQSFPTLVKRISWTGWCIIGNGKQTNYRYLVRRYAIKVLDAYATC